MIIITKSSLTFFLALLGLFQLLSTTSMAQGDLLIYPKRIVFESTKKTHQVSLSNTGKDTARYAISFIQIRMKENGSTEPITQPDSGQNFSDKYLRIYPRIVTLGPNEAQMIMIQVSRSSKLLPGEYRSHLYIRSVPLENPLGDSLAKKGSEGVSVKVIPVFGFSIPVIIREGANDIKVSVTNLRVEKQQDFTSMLKMRFNRTGNMSVYGNIVIDYISDAGKITQVGLIKGISVYTPNQIRDIEIQLDSKLGLKYQSGKLRVLYTSPNEEKFEKFASAELAL